MDDADSTPWGAIEKDNTVKAEAPEAVQPTDEGVDPVPTATDQATTDMVEGPAPTTMDQITPETVAGGYQAGANPQQLVVASEGKGPKGAMIVAGVLAAIGVIGLIAGAIFAGSIEGMYNELETADHTKIVGSSAELTYNDQDGLGEEGWYLLIPGDPKADENNNGIMDACEDVNFIILDADGNDASERAARISCSTSTTDDGSNAGEPYWDIKDAIVVARICHTFAEEGESVEHRCAEGEVFTVSNDANVSMSVVDLDAMLIPFVEDAIGAGLLSAAGFGAGCCSMCGGLVALIVGLTRLGGGKPKQNVQFQIH